MLGGTIKRCYSSRSNYLIKTYKIYEELFLVYYVYFIRSFVIVFKNTWHLLETTLCLFELLRWGKVEQNETA